jgi:dihydroorotase
LPSRSAITRRDFIGQLGAAAILIRGPVAEVAQTRRPPFDLLIAGGHVIDASQGLSAVRDVALAGGSVARVAAAIPPNQARQVFDARGKFVTPGLIDLHGHVFDGVAAASIDAALVGTATGVTTIVDAGSAGAVTFPGFRRHVIDRANVRIYALLNMSTIGLVVFNELYLDPRMIDPKAAIEVIQSNRDRVLGIKVRVNGRHEDLAHDVDVLKKAREASDATGVPIMLHWTNERDLLAILKRGDILTHPFNPPSPASSNLIGGDGDRILGQILELKDRGIWTDFAHGTHLSWDVAEKAAKHNWFPDTISTDIHRGHVAPSGVVFDLVTTMTKFLYLGLSVDQVVERVTTIPARVLSFPERIGTLKEGTVGDVTILELVQGDVELFDSRRQRRIGRQRLKTVATIKSGAVVRT